MVCEAAELGVIECGEPGQNIAAIYLIYLFSDGRRPTAASPNIFFTTDLFENLGIPPKFFATQSTHTKTAGISDYLTDSLEKDVTFEKGT